MNVTDRKRAKLSGEPSKKTKEDKKSKNKAQKINTVISFSESDEKFKGVVELSADAIITASLDGAIIGCNAAACKIFGYSQKQMLKLCFADLTPTGGDYSLLQFLPDEFREDVKSPEWINKRKDGSLFPAEINAKIFSGDEHKFLIVYIRDITERKTAELKLGRFNEKLKQKKIELENKIIQLDSLNEQLSDSEKRLKELNESKDKFFSIIAHDLRSPFNGLIGFSEFLANGIDDLKEEDIKKFAKEINRAANNLFKLLNNLLDWSRIQVGTMQFLPHKINLKIAAADIVSLLKSSAEKKNISLVNNIKKDVVLLADGNMIHSILLNLTSNSIKFTPPGGKVKLTIKETDSFVDLTVEDNGVGIEKEKLKNIFNIGVYKSTVGTSNEKGSGLGLTLCKDFVEMHKGKITCRSEKGKGSKFIVSLPKTKLSF